MFTLDDMRSLLNALPFVPFRLHLSDGGAVEVRHREVAMPGRRFALVGLLDPNTTDTVFDRWAAIWYMHVSRVEMIDPGAPPFTSSTGPAEPPVPSPT